MTSTGGIPRLPAGTSSLLEVRDLRTTFRTRNGPLCAVDGVSFGLDAGETVGIVGESGSGKSVLVRSIMGLLPPSATVNGRVCFEGSDLSALGDRERQRYWGREIAMVFQDPMTSLNPVRRIGVQLADPLRRHLGLSRSEARARALELLRLVRIPEPERRLSQYPHELSGGMRQRIVIAIAVSCQPKLLLADEPTTALDVTVQRQILDLLTVLQRQLGMAMILITHDLGVVAGRAARVLVMYGGHIVEEAATADLFTRARHPYSKALLASTPRLAQPSHTKLASIPGRPPDLLNRAPGCRFAPRCSAAQADCLRETPALLDIDVPDGHRFACFHPVEDPVEVPVEPRA